MHQFSFKMAEQGDFLYGDDLDALLIAIDADILENDVDFESEINSMVSEIPEEVAESSFLCSL